MLRLASDATSSRSLPIRSVPPTGADLIADVTAHAIRAVQVQPTRAELLGLYHLVGQWAHALA